MGTWTVELTAGEKALAEVKIQRVIFLEEALLPLLFVIAMISHSREMYSWIQTQ